MEKNIPVFYDAAGGVLYHPDREEVLVLIRPSRDEVRLPKGHIESDETPEEAALREVREETGYADLSIAADLGEQLVVFPFGKHVIRRTEHYYLMHPQSPRQITRPAADREDFFPIWITLDKALEHLTFEAEQEWIRRAQTHLKEQA